MTLEEAIGYILAAIDKIEKRLEILETLEVDTVAGSGNGVAGRAAEWSDDSTITAADICLSGTSGKTLTLNENLTLDGTSGKSLTVNENLTLAGASGKALTLTTNLTNQGNNGTLNWGGAYTLTLPATGTAAVGAGTLTAATANNVSTANHTHEVTGFAAGAGTLTASTTNDATLANHTHAITASANTSAGGASILKSDANGGLELDRLGIDTAAAAAGDLTVAMDGRFGGGLYVGDTGVNPAAGTITADGYISCNEIKTAAGYLWNIGGYSATLGLTPDGFITITINSVTYRLLCYKP